MSNTDLKVRVWRGSQEGEFVEYLVPRNPNQTVLDVVTYIQRKLDPTLSYRFACRVGMCGSCAMTVNGVARWTCRTHVSQILQGDSLEIAPLNNLPVIKDLATDMREFFNKWKGAVGFFKGNQTRHDVGSVTRRKRDNDLNRSIRERSSLSANKLTKQANRQRQNCSH